VSTEFAVTMTAFLSAFMLLVVFAGRVAQAENDVRTAVHEAARAASLTNTPEAATAEATRVAHANLTTSGLSCANGTDLTVGVGDFRPGGWVTVTVSCSASFSDLAPLAVPGSRTFTNTATEVIDTYRAHP
jgi:Flp pilus assembly protein TadG